MRIVNILRSSRDRWIQRLHNLAGVYRSSDCGYNSDNDPDIINEVPNASSTDTVAMVAIKSAEG
ncbi:hypothetical protein OROHE_009301 [Orobanche hederae]